MFSNEIVSTFSELEISLYNYMIKNSEKVIYMRIRDLANETHISTSSILRFCRKLKCEGFSEFKVKLKLHLDAKNTVKIKSALHSLSDFMDRTLKGDFDSIIHKAATVINQSEHVIFVGIASSGILAEYGARYFSSVGKFSLYIKDPHFPIESSYLTNSVTIVLSVSGETTSTIKHINKLKQEGSTIISITNNKVCTVAKISDLNIPYYVSEEKLNTSNITTQIPVVYIVEALAREVYRIALKNE